jgi:hypothetical protein
MEWVSALWKQIKGEPVPDPWDNDPDILAVRERQHAMGVTDYEAVRDAEAQFWRKVYIRDQLRKKDSPGG